VSLENSLDERFQQETTACIHFLLLLLLVGEAKLQRETVLFQKFFRENRYRLITNGITPPAKVFSSASYASINVPLVAVWLASLSADERERFSKLKVCTRVRGRAHVKRL
jgi:hypothetical protein